MSDPSKTVTHDSAPSERGTESSERDVVTTPTHSIPRRAGHVALVGRPNAGKSTLLNALIGQRLAITSAKAQSTRQNVVGLLTSETSQMILVDTPGLLDPRYALHRAMRASALAALADADVVLHIVDTTDASPRSLDELLGDDAVPLRNVITVLNKCDVLPSDAMAPADDDAWGPSTVRVSALTGAGLDVLLGRVEAMLPVSPFLYGADDASTQSMRFFVTEMVREAVFEQLEDELPYSVHCQVEEYHEDEDPVYIRVVLYVERDSQKGIVLGHKGSRIRSIGEAARGKIEQLVGARVYLDTWVKVLPNWRRNVAALERFGFSIPADQD